MKMVHLVAQHLNRSSESITISSPSIIAEPINKQNENHDTLLHYPVFVYSLKKKKMSEFKIILHVK